jgi:hypothetical protein
MTEILVILEIVAGLTALVLTAMGFTNLAWAQGASSPELQRASSAKTRRLLIWGGVFWAITVLCLYLTLVLSGPMPGLSPQG